MAKTVITFEGLELAVKNFNKYQGTAVVFVDYEDNTAWCEVLNIPTYHSDSIIALLGKDDLYSRNDKYRIAAVQNLAIAAKKEIDNGYEESDLDYVLAKEYWEAAY